MAQIISGKEVALKVRESIKAEVKELFEKTGKRPGLAVIIVGEDPASQVYVRNKAKGCEEVGFHSEVYRLAENTQMDELLALIEKLNKDENIHGILCQLPLPKHLDETAVILAIDPDKDVDAFHPVNTGKIMIGNYSFLPCTPAGVMELIASTGVDISGKECVVVGRSNIVGKPMAALLLERNATVTVCHSRTKDLASFTKNADIIVAAVGRANFITADMVKEGAVIVDVGINRLPNGKLCGDVDFENVKEKASFITPVPGGCGPMTIAVLMKNTLVAYKNQNN